MSEEKVANRMSRYVENKEEETPQIVSKEKNEVKTSTPKKQINPKLKKSLIFISVILIILFVYSLTIGKTIIEVKEYKVESNILPDSFHGMKIVHFSDIHYGTSINKKQLEKIVIKINELKPDIILFTGNLVDENIEITDNIQKEITDSLNKLEANSYKYAVYGTEDKNDNYQNIMNDTGFILLNNESKLLFYKDNTPIMITGYNTIDTKPNYTILSDYIEELNPNDLYRIVLVHEPDSIDNFIQYNPDLVLAGHSLGGLIDLAFTKPLFLPENSKKYYKDYYKVNNTKLFVSSGLGTAGINARFNNQPSINFYRLYKTN